MTTPVEERHRQARFNLHLSQTVNTVFLWVVLFEIDSEIPGHFIYGI